MGPMAWQLLWLLLSALSFLLQARGGDLDGIELTLRAQETPRRKTGVESSQVVCTHDRAVLTIVTPFHFLRTHCQAVAEPPGQPHQNNPSEPWVDVDFKARDLPSLGASYELTTDQDANGARAGAARFHLCTAAVRRALLLEKEILRPPKPRQVIWCSLDKDLCRKPVPVEAIGTGLFGEVSEDEAHSTLTITFDQSTNMPPVEGVAGVNSVLSFSAKIGKDYTGEWLSPRKLRVTLLDTTGRDDRSKLAVGALNVYFVSRVPQTEDMQRQAAIAKKKAKLSEYISTLQSTNFTLPLARPGFYEAALHVNQARRQVGYRSQITMEAHACGDIAVGEIDTDQIYISKGGASKREAEVNLPMIPFYAPNGIISLDGTRAMRLPSKHFGSAWSISMWIFIAEDSTGTHRGIFYKGPIPSDGHRTPSVWLLPDSRQISIRFSQEDNMDAGVTVEKELPLSSWVHMAFVFQNFISDVGNNLSLVSQEEAMPHTPKQQPPAKHFIVDCYIDGAREVHLEALAPVLRNDGDLHIGRDPWMHGVKGLLTGLKVYSHFLSSSEVKYEYESLHTHLMGSQSRSQAAGMATSSHGIFAMKEMLQVDFSRNETVKFEKPLPLPICVPSSSSEHCDVQDASIADSEKARGVQQQNQLGKLFFPRSSPSEDASEIFQEAMALIESCDQLEKSLTLLVAAGKMGHAEAFYVAGSLLLHGPSAHAKSSTCNELSASAMLGLEFYHKDPDSIIGLNECWPRFSCSCPF